MWDLNSPTRDQIQIPCVGNQILSHWTTREVPHTTLNGRTRIKLTWFPSLSSFSLCQLHPQGWELSKGKELWDYKLPAWVKWSEVAQLCPTLCDPMDTSLPGSVIHGIFQARILEWTAISFSRGSSWPRDQTWVSCIADRRFTVWATREEYLLIIKPTLLWAIAKYQALCWELCMCLLNLIPHNSMK